VLATAKGLASLHSTDKPLICGKFNASNMLLDSVNILPVPDVPLFILTCDDPAN
jgi:hypothetical protein